MQWISKTFRKAHGAFKPFMARLCDAIFIVAKEDLEAVVQALKCRGMSDAEIELKKKLDWGFFLKHCHRWTPAPSLLSSRIQKVCNVFASMKDSATGSVFFTKETQKEVKNLFTSRGKRLLKRRAWCSNILCKWKNLFRATKLSLCTWHKCQRGLSSSSSQAATPSC
jgi:hypothetical protein